MLELNDLIVHQLEKKRADIFRYSKMRIKIVGWKQLSFLCAVMVIVVVV